MDKNEEAATRVSSTLHSPLVNHGNGWSTTPGGVHDAQYSDWFTHQPNMDSPSCLLPQSQSSQIKE
jgi:hypothetical protein